MHSSQWYVARQNRKVGPLTTAQLQQLVGSGQLSRDDMLLEKGTAQWVAARTIPGLFPVAPTSRRVWPWAAAIAVIGMASGFGVKALLNRENKPPEKQDAKLDPSNDEKPPPSKEPVKKDDVPPPVEKEKPSVEPTPDPEKAKREEDFQRYLKAGLTLHDAKQFDAAIKALNEAVVLMPDSMEALDALKAAEKARTDAIVVENKQREKEQQDRAFNLLLESGRANLARQQFDLAALTLNEALKLMPGNVEAQAALRQAEIGRQAAANAAAANAAAAAAAAQQKLRLDAYQKWVNDGRHALFTLRKYELAMNAFQEAQKLFPGDRASADFLKQAEKARDDEAATLRAQNRLLEEELLRVTELRKLLAQSRVSMRNGDLLSAERLLEAAARLSPNDPGVTAARRDLNTARTETALKKAELEQKARVREYLKDGHAALLKGQLQAAEQAFEAAAKLDPSDPAVIQARRDLRTETMNRLAQQKLLADHQALLKAGRDALQAKKYDDAIQSLTAARQLIPTDRVGNELLAGAVQAKEDALKTVDADRKKAEETQKALKVQGLIKDGRAALAKGQIQAAEQAFDAAFLLLPNDPAVLLARKDLQAARRDTASLAKRQAEYQGLLKSGRDALTAKRYDDAINAFATASRLIPDDRAAKDLHAEALKQRDAALKSADTAKKMMEDQQRALKVRDLLQDGHTALNKRQYQTAERAFNEARQLAPNDPKVKEALQSLDQARKLGVQFTLAVDAAVTIAQGGKARVRVTVDRKGNTGYQEAIEVELRGLPSGVGASRATIPPGQTSTTLELSANPNAKLGADRNVQAIGTGRGIAGHVNSNAMTVTVQKK